MPHRVYIDPDRTLGVVKWEGLVDGDDIVWGLQSLYGNDLWKPSFRSCWDSSGLDRLLLSLAGTQRVVEVGKVASGDIGQSLTASVVTNDLHRASMSMLGGLIRLKWMNLKFFKSTEAAALWLGVDPNWLTEPLGLVATRESEAKVSTD